MRAIGMYHNEQAAAHPLPREPQVPYSAQATRRLRIESCNKRQRLMYNHKRQYSTKICIT